MYPEATFTNLLLNKIVKRFHLVTGWGPCYSMYDIHMHITIILLNFDEPCSGDNEHIDHRFVVE